MRIIPVHAQVMCTDGDAGTSKAVIVDPKKRRLTHVVVREHGFVDSERLVSMDYVDETTEDCIWLRCTRDELHRMDDFIEAHFVDLTYATPAYPGPSYDGPQISPLVVSEKVPTGEIALRRSAVVEATDGPVGHVESLAVDAPDHRITHVLVRTRHFLTRQEAALPVADVQRFASNCVFLRVSRRNVERLPHVRFHEGSLLMGLEATDTELVPQDPREAGLRVELDVSHLEAAHVLAEEVGPRLRAQGFNHEQILHWAEAFLRVERSGGAADLLEWIRKQQQAPTPRSRRAPGSGRRLTRKDASKAG